DASHAQPCIPATTPPAGAVGAEAPMSPGGRIAEELRSVAWTAGVCADTIPAAKESPINTPIYDFVVTKRGSCALRLGQHLVLFALPRTIRVAGRNKFVRLWQRIPGRFQNQVFSKRQDP